MCASVWFGRCRTQPKRSSNDLRKWGRREGRRDCLDWNPKEPMGTDSAPRRPLRARGIGRVNHSGALPDRAQTDVDAGKEPQAYSVANRARITDDPRLTATLLLVGQTRCRLGGGKRTDQILVLRSQVVGAYLVEDILRLVVLLQVDESPDFRSAQVNVHGVAVAA